METKKKYIKWQYLSLGIALGCLVGVLTDNVSLWLSVGVATGIALDMSAQKNNKEDKDQNS